MDQDLRREAMHFAVMATDNDQGPNKVVEAAEKFYAFLTKGEEPKEN